MSSEDQLEDPQKIAHLLLDKWNSADQKAKLPFDDVPKSAAIYLAKRWSAATKEEKAHINEAFGFAVLNLFEEIVTKK